MPIEEDIYVDYCLHLFNHNTLLYLMSLNFFRAVNHFLFHRYFIVYFHKNRRKLTLGKTMGLLWGFLLHTSS